MHKQEAFINHRASPFFNSKYLFMFFIYKYNRL